MVSRAAQNSRLRELTEAQAVPTVAIVTPSRAQNHAGLDLPGRLEAYIRAPIYARVHGYLKSWKHDIGSQVKAGEVLAEIDTPDLDQQLHAGARRSERRRGQREAGADHRGALAVARRHRCRRQAGGRPAHVHLNANIAQVKAAQANVDRLVAEEGFKRLIAPFDGIVTARETDIGALINVGAAGGAELFVVSDTRKLRVYVNVPQNYVPSVPPGTLATIRVPEHPDRTYQRDGRGFGPGGQPEHRHDPDADHRRQQRRRDDAGRLREHPFADRRRRPCAQRTLERADFRCQGAFRSRPWIPPTASWLKPVSIARDLGTVVELASGLAPNDRVIENPPDGVGNGAIGAPRAARRRSGRLAKAKHQNEKG